MLSAEDKATVENELAEFKKVRETNDAEQIKNATEAFTQKVYAVFGKIYQQQGAGDPNAPGGRRSERGQRFFRRRERRGLRRSLNLKNAT